MREAKLRVELMTINNNTTAYYGNVMTKKVVEDYHIAEYDKRKNIAPHGLYASIAIDKKDKNLDGEEYNEKDIFEIKIDASYFCDENENRYIAFFHIEDKTYEVCMWVNEEGVEDVTLSIWYSYGDFEEGDDADTIIHMDKFIFAEAYYN